MKRIDREGGKDVAEVDVLLIAKNPTRQQSTLGYIIPIELDEAR